MTPLLFAAAGGLFPALAGTLNIALEGLLLIGAFSAMAVFYFTGSFIAAVLAAIASSLALSCLHAFAAFKLRANVFIAGLAVNLLSTGITVLLSGKIFKSKGVIVSQHQFTSPDIYPFAALFLLVILWTVIYKTPFGYRLRACEKNSASLASLGINPQDYQIAALLICGICCGIGGSFLSLNLGAFVPGMSSGRGWIALVIIFLGGKKPHGILAAAFIFALAEAFSIYAQGLWKIPADFVFIFPYVCTLIALILVNKPAVRQHPQ
jgi:simple sugar transport system permease protein